MRCTFIRSCAIVAGLAFTLEAHGAPAEAQATVTIHWDHVVRVVKTAPTYQIVASPLLLPNSSVHDQAYRALRDLHAEFARFQSWYAFPRLGVAELSPPQAGKTYWDFSLMDPLVVDFLKATEGHKVILDLSTIPQWMFKTAKPVAYPADPNQLDYDYEQGTDLRDPSLKEVADYFARLVGWYTQGGFNDEFGQRHSSGHHFKIDYWEVLNEVDFEHRMSPETYTAIYDAVVGAVRRIDPNMKFVGPALGTMPVPPEWDQSRFFEYFLNHDHHQPGIPIDMISYHVYASPGADEDPYVQQFTIFEQTDSFLRVMRYIDRMRQRLSPNTQTTIDEIGTISNDDGSQGDADHVTKPIPDSYWNLSAAMYAHIYIALSHFGVESAGMSSGLDYPRFFPSVTMLDWSSGQPNARYWALKLLIDNVSRFDRQVETENNLPFVEAQAYITPQGRRKILLVNKRDRPFTVAIRNIKGSVVEYVDESTGFQPPASRALTDDGLTLQNYAVSVVSLAQ